jgi:hypothetical protein
MLNSGLVPDDATYDILDSLKHVEASRKDSEILILDSAS